MLIMTKYLIILFGCLLGLTSSTFNNGHIKKFKKGEKVKYRLHYGFITAGEATISVNPNYTSRSGKNYFDLNIKGKSTGAFAKVMKINDHWRSLVDTNSLKPVLSYREIQESRYYLKETVDFRTDIATVTSEKKDHIKKTKKHKIPSDVFDMVSAYYYLRNVDYKNLNVNEKIAVKAFFEDKLYNFSIQYKGIESVKTKLGKIKAHKITPVMPGNELFDGEDSINIWLSADKNQIPLKIKAKMFVGAVEIEIKSFEGLKHDLKIEN